MKCHEKINFFVQILLPVLAVGEWRDLVLAFGKARQTLLFAK